MEKNVLIPLYLFWVEEVKFPGKAVAFCRNIRNICAHTVKKKKEVIFMTMQEYFYKQGIDEQSSSEEVLAAKMRYQKLWRKDWEKERKGKVKRKELVVPTEDFLVFEARAKAAGMKVETYIRTAALAYSQGEFLQAETEAAEKLLETLRQLKNMQRKTGVNVNQIAHYVNLEKELPEGYKQELLRHLDRLEDMSVFHKMEDLVHDAFYHPRRTVKAVADELAKGGACADELRALFLSELPKTAGDDSQ